MTVILWPHDLPSVHLPNVSHVTVGTSKPGAPMDAVILWMPDGSTVPYLLKDYVLIEVQP